MDETTSTHTNANNSDPTIETKDEFVYDHVGRLKTQTQTIAGVHAAELIVSNIYDKLGQLVSKDVGNTDTKPLQTIDFTYNIRGWLQGINNEGGSNSAITLGSGDLFGFQINYNDPSTETGLFNGNIKQTLWKTTSTNPAPYNPVSNMYTYTYDALNRITDATDNTTNYNVHDITYDRNGNLITLKREGKNHAVNNTFSIMDNLSYTYTVNGIETNQLQSVNDSSGSTEGFNNGATSSVEYTYDANGNMMTDANKGITAISYNHLNLPTQVTLASGNIQYIYDAIGTKLRKIVSSGVTTNYAGNYIYEGSSLKFFNHGEGYIEPDGSGGYEYVYQYKDHLGNIRINYKDVSLTSTPSLEIQEENNYYPFGLKHKGYNNTPLTNHMYKYNGKEWDQSLDLNTFDLGARQMDPALGRFMVIDPMADFVNNQSPYVVANNNPIGNVDEYGLGILNAIGNLWKRLKNGVKKIFSGSNCDCRGQVQESLAQAFEREDFPNRSRSRSRKKRTTSATPSNLVRRPKVTGINLNSFSIVPLDGGGITPPQIKPEYPIDLPDSPVPPQGRISFDKDIKFTQNSSNFEDVDHTEKTLVDLIKTLKEYSQLQVLILGNFSNPDPNANRDSPTMVNGTRGTVGALQLLRARAVEQFLINKGIDWRRLKIGNGTITNGSMNSTFIISNPNN